MISIDPMLPLGFIAAVFGVAFIITLFTTTKRNYTSILRLLLVSAIMLVLIQPIHRIEHRQSQADIALVVTDHSASMALDDRGIKANALAQTLVNTKLPNMIWRQATIPAAMQNPQRTDGFTGLQKSLAQIPRDRLAGTILITDGLFHDQPQLEKLRALGKPVHVVIAGDPQMPDRRISVLAAPPFTIVGAHAHPRIKVDDGTTGNPVVVNWQLNGVEQTALAVSTGTAFQLDVPITRRGAAEITVAVATLSGERITSNNRALFSINGVRDRLNVLLITGAPYPGARLWRDTLKSDPSIDLIHFTILRLPTSVDQARNDELALIPFPVNQLFEERLKSFDLVIFDRYAALDLLQPDYFTRLTQYVSDGGALLIVAGPEFNSPQSLATTGLSALLPVMPGDAAPTAPFIPEITTLGARHPVVNTLRQPWGPWFQFTRGRAVSGQTLMKAGPSPLLQVNEYGHGRVAMLMSDQLWLWARSDQPGPWDDLVRRTAHWLMKEPDLEAEQLRLSATAVSVVAERHSLGTTPETMIFTLPNGTHISKPSVITVTGQLATVALAGPGIYSVRQGKLSASVNVGADAPEFADIRPTERMIKPLTEATAGGISFGTLPTIKRISATASHYGAGWFGLVENNNGTLVGVDETPLLPPWLALLTISALAVFTWWRERG